MRKTLIKRKDCSSRGVHSRYTRIDVEREFPPFLSVTENLRILVSEQPGKATSFVAYAAHRLGELPSPDLPPNDNHVFSDRAKARSGHGAFSMALTISRIGLQPTNLNP